MKKIIQLVLLSFLILIAVVFYNVYLSNPKQIEPAVIKDQDQLNTINERYELL